MAASLSILNDEIDFGFAARTKFEASFCFICLAYRLGFLSLRCSLNPFSIFVMSRQYHVLGDTRTCTRCDSPCALFGQRDVETFWFGWCVLCNTTWHNRRIESVLTSVSRNFALRSLAALVGNKKAASVTLTFLQTSVGCVKYKKLLRHHLNLCLLMWLCCPLERWYEEDSEAEEERIRRPVLRTLQETAISSRAFKARCFPCIQSKDRSWTLLHAVCSYLRLDTHTCESTSTARRIPGRAYDQ